MSALSIAPAAKPPDGIPEDEWRARVDLAACYRLFHHFRMTDLIYNHISVRLPGRHDQFLINPYGLLYDEVTASSLVVVDTDGKVIRDLTGLGINPRRIHDPQRGSHRTTRCGLRDAYPHCRDGRGLCDEARTPSADPAGDALHRPDRLSRL